MNLDSHAILRKFLDGKEGLVSGGHGIIKTAGATQHAARMRRVPVWALDDGKIREVLLKSFPKLSTDSKQREQAARWLRIIHLYWRLGMTRGQVAYEVGKTDQQVHFLLVAIKRAMEGKRANGSGPRGGKVGRPKKISAPIDATIGSSGNDGHISL